LEHACDYKQAILHLTAKIIKNLSMQLGARARQSC